MQFKASIEIEKPKQHVADLFANPANQYHYQDGFEKRVPISGATGQDGSICELHYDNRGRKMVLEEIVISNCLPDSFEAKYVHPMMENILRTAFTEIAPGRTRYTIEAEYTAINGLVPRLIALLAPGVFTRQGKTWMANFKRFAEAQP